MVNVGIDTSAVDTHRSALFDAGIDHRDGERRATFSRPRGACLISVVLEECGIFFSFAPGMAGGVGSQPVRVLNLVSFLVRRRLLGMLQNPCSSARGVTRLTVRKPAIKALAVARKIVQFLSNRAPSASFHLISITQKYNTAVADGWKLFRTTPRTLPDLRPFLIAALKR